MKSLRSRLVAITLLVLTLVLGYSGWAAHSIVRAKLVAEFDRNLAGRARALTAFIDKEEGAIAIEWVTLALDHPPGGDPKNEFVQIWNGVGETIYRSAELTDQRLPTLEGTLETPATRSVQLPYSQPGRAAGIVFTVSVDEEDAEDERAAGIDVEPETVTLTVARVDTVTPMLATLRQRFILLWFVASLIGGALVWFNIRRTLRPLDTLRRQIRELREGTRQGGVEMRSPPAELEPVAAELNRLIVRLENAITRERSLTSNVAHELRTPIAGLLSTLEVTLSRERAAPEYREAASESFEIAKRMHWLVNNLLSLTRIESGAVEIQNHIVEVEPSLKAWWQAFADHAEEKEISIDWQIAPDTRLETDPEFLRVIVTNLYDNAVSYTPQRGTITISADERGTITIGNDTVGLDPEDAAKVFEPFWRESESRNDIGTHAGLGLALCQKIADLLGGSLRAAAPDSGKRFEISLNLVSVTSA